MALHPNQQFFSYIVTEPSFHQSVIVPFGVNFTSIWGPGCVCVGGGGGGGLNGLAQGHYRA